MRQKNDIMSLSESCIPSPHLCGGMLPSQLQLNRTGFLPAFRKGGIGCKSRRVGHCEVRIVFVFLLNRVYRYLDIDNARNIEIKTFEISQITQRRPELLPSPEAEWIMHSRVLFWEQPGVS